MNNDCTFDLVILTDSKEEKSRVLKNIEMDVVDHSTCENKLRLAKKPNKKGSQKKSNRPILGSSFKLHSSFLCAGGDEGRDTCTGDGGSPLVCPSHDYSHFFQVGSSFRDYFIKKLISCRHAQVNTTV